MYALKKIMHSFVVWVCGDFFLAFGKYEVSELEDHVYSE